MASVLAPACDPRAPVPPADAAAPSAVPAARAAQAPQSQALATLLAARSTKLVDTSTDGSLALVVDDRGRTTLFSRERSAGRPYVLAEGAEALALSGDGGRVLVAEPSPTAGVSRLAIVTPDGARVVLQGFARAPRVVGAALRDAVVYVATERDAGGGELLSEISAARPAPRWLASFDAGFRVEAVASDGARAAVRRELHPEADELYLWERATGALRLLLPDGGDARFRPLGFGPGASEMLLLTDRDGGPLRLERVDFLTSSHRSLPLARPGSGEAPGEIVSARLARDGRTVAVVTTASGRREAFRIDATNGLTEPVAEIPTGMRAVDLGASTISDLASGSLHALVAAGDRFPRDLFFAGPPGTETLPRTWGLAPAIEPGRLATASIRILDSPAGELPIEVWKTDGASGRARPGLLWIEDDAAPPAWEEYDPLFQYVALRGGVVVRLRLHGADGFGRTFRHAADGSPVETAMADVQAALAAAIAEGAAPDRIGLVGDGPWPGAVAAALAGGADAELVALGRRFAAIAAHDADPDPLREVETFATLPQPARDYWSGRFGPPEKAAAARARVRSTDPGGAPAAVESAARAANAGPAFRESRGKLDRAALWRFLSVPLGGRPPA